MKALIPLSLLTAAGAVQAHVADLSPAQHASEHAWLALVLVPLALLLIPLLRRKR